MTRNRSEETSPASEAIICYIYTVFLEAGITVQTTHSDTCVNVTGYTAQEFSNDPDLWINMVLEKDRELVRQQATHILSGHFPQPIEHRITRKDGIIRWIDSIVVPHHDTEGNLISYSGIIRDITESKQVKEQLIQSHDLMDYTISHAQGCIAVHDKNMIYMYVSERYLKEYKVKEKNIIGKHHYEVFPDLPQKWRDVHQRALAGEVSSAEEDPYYREDGSVDWTRWECRPWYESDGSVGGLIVYTEIINDRMSIEEDLRNRGSFIESLINLSPDIIYIYDIVEQKNVYSNNGIQTVLGYSVEDIQKMGNKFIQNSMHPDDLKNYFEETIPRYEKAQDNELISHEYRMKHKNGNWHWLNSAELIYKRQPDGSPCQIFGVVHDITESRKAEEKIKSSLREKEVLLREIHHRVKNNFAVIIGLLRLQGGSIKDDKLKAIFKDSENRIRSMSLVHEMLYGTQDLAQIDFGVYIQALTKGLLSTYRATAGKIIIKTDIKDITLNTDTAIILGLVTNELISNAMKYAFPGERRGEIIIGMKSTDGVNKYELMIKDNGVGLPEGLDILQTDTLGLRMVTNIVEQQLHGRIEMKRDGGTEFKIGCKAVEYKDRLNTES
jgi:PAS domain S-box-containing protein